MVKQIKNNNKVEKALKKDGRYLSVGEDFKAELFIRVNILLFIIAEKLNENDSTDRILSIPKEIVKEIDGRVNYSLLSYKTTKKR